MFKPRTHGKVLRSKLLMEVSETDVKTDRLDTRHGECKSQGVHCIPTQKLVCGYGWSGEVVPHALSNTKEKRRCFSKRK